MWGLADKKKAEEITGKTNVPSVSTVSTPNSLSASNVSDNFNPSLECRKAVNLEKPECVKWFDQISKNKNSVSSTGAVVEAVSYNPNKPYDFEYQPQVTPTDFPKMSGVIKLSSGKLIALDQQGNYMQNVSQDDCKKWLSGYRPFNYFAQQKQSTERVSTSESENINFATSSL
jgi:hypothetical protein